MTMVFPQADATALPIYAMPFCISWRMISAGMVLHVSSARSLLDEVGLASRSCAGCWRTNRELLNVSDWQQRLQFPVTSIVNRVGC